MATGDVLAIQAAQDFWLMEESFHNFDSLHSQLWYPSNRLW